MSNFRGDGKGLRAQITALGGSVIRRSSHPSVCGQQKSLKREEREPEEPSGEALWADTLDRSGTVN